jgi:glucosamine 6-phosphate synthetase-like amidotransferase/phosphosugar isomerase protein
MALTQVVGAYAIVILSKNDPNYLIGAKKGSPMGNWYRRRETNISLQVMLLLLLNILAM